MRLLSICVVGRLHNPISFVLFSCKSPFSGPTSLAFLKLEQAPASLTISSVAQILLCCVSMLPPSTKKYSFCLSLLFHSFPPPTNLVCSVFLNHLLPSQSLAMFLLCQLPYSLACVSQEQLRSLPSRPPTLQDGWLTRSSVLWPSSFGGSILSKIWKILLNCFI